MLNLFLLLFTLYIPFEDKTMDWFKLGGLLNLTNIFLAILFIICLISSNKNGSSIKSPLNTSILMFLIAMYLSLWIGSFNFGYSAFGPILNSYKRFITTFLVYYISFYLIKNRGTMKLLFFTMIIITMFISVVALREFKSSWHYQEQNRMQILGMQPNLLGGFFMQLVPVHISFIISLKKFKSQILYFFAFFLAILAVMFSYSRGAYLSAMVSILVIALIGGRKSFIKITVFGVAALLFISVFFGSGNLIPVSVKERFEMGQNKEKREQDVSVQTREYVWKITSGYISQSPIYGHGFEASAYLLPLDTHNMYLDLLLEGGIIALIFFLLIFLIGFKIAYSVFKNSSDEFEKALSLGFIGTLIAIFVGNFFGTRMNHFASNGYFAILMGMVARLYAEKRKLGIIKR